MAQVNIRMDDELKKQADAFFGALGLSLSTAIHAFILQSMREGRIPFELSLKVDPFYSESNMAHLLRGIDELNRGQGVEHELIEVD
jgi:DNA-damage-inducible protein J